MAMPTKSKRRYLCCWDNTKLQLEQKLHPDGKEPLNYKFSDSRGSTLLGDYTLGGLHSWGSTRPTLSWSTDFGFGEPPTHLFLGVYSLGVYAPGGRQALELWILVWRPTHSRVPGGLESRGPEV